jgi:hypothetical protein
MLLIMSTIHSMVPTKDKMSKSLEEENNNVTPRSLVHLCTIVLNGRHVFPG